MTQSMSKVESVKKKGSGIGLWPQRMIDLGLIELGSKYSWSRYSPKRIPKTENHRAWSPVGADTGLLAAGTLQGKNGSLEKEFVKESSVHIIANQKGCFQQRWVLKDEKQG